MQAHNVVNEMRPWLKSYSVRMYGGMYGGMEACIYSRFHRPCMNNPAPPPARIRPCEASWAPRLARSCAKTSFFVHEQHSTTSIGNPTCKLLSPYTLLLTGSGFGNDVGVWLGHGTLHEQRSTHVGEQHGILGVLL